MQVWKKVKRSSIPRGRHCNKCKWVFDIKRNGVFPGQLVACGYSQIPGVDFRDAYSPVTNDSTFHIIIFIQIIFGLRSHLLDIEVAFLHGNLDEEIYMYCPPSYDHEPDEVLLLLKALYRLVQAARQFFKKFTSIMKQIGFEQNPAEPCMLFKKEDSGLPIVVIHVDDWYVIGSEENMDKLMSQLTEAGLKVKVEKETKDYLGCEIIMSKDNTQAWLDQPFIVKKMLTRFADVIGMSKIHYKTPGTPGFNIICPVTKDEEISQDDQKVYREGVGALLYLIKYSIPDISNMVRELAKCMDKATPAAFKEMKRVMRFIAGTKDYGLKIAPKKPDQDNFKWNMVVYSNSDWAGDKDDHHSVSGYVTIILGVPIMWKL
jgi:Reverse transcriptase (RNA-dependent DNA polymerase)